MNHFGLLNLNKPPAWTSRRVVDHVLRLVRPAKAGHAGTLDPLATGVLVVCVGPATRLIEYVQAQRKSYTATFLLGRDSPTEDIEGEVVELADPPRPTREQLEQAAAALTGSIQQRPPAFSALKIGGQRAYDLARAGREVRLEARPIDVYRLEIVRYDYPELVLQIECGSGTYVRSLGRDLASSLGTAAVMSALVRTAIGPFTLADASDPESLTRDTLPRLLLPPLRAVEHLPRVVLNADEMHRVYHGMSIRRPEAEAETPAAAELAAIDATGALVAIMARRADGSLSPKMNFRVQ